MPSWSTPSLADSCPQPSPSSQGKQTMRPFETPIVFSPQIRHQPRVPAARSRTATSGSSWWQLSMPSSDKPHLSARPTPFERPPSRRVKPPSTRRRSFASTPNSVDNTKNVVTLTLYSAIRRWWRLKTLTYLLSRTTSQATPEQPCSASSSTSMTTTRGYWPQTCPKMTRIWVKYTIPTIPSIASKQG